MYWQIQRGQGCDPFFRIPYCILFIGQIMEKKQHKKNLNPCHQMAFLGYKYAKLLLWQRLCPGLGWGSL